METPQLTVEDFRDHVGTSFALKGSEPPRHLVLEEATPIPMRHVPDGFRAPFRLMFRLNDARVFPQHLYVLDHAAIGEVAIFLVPESQDADGVRYCATFA